jgi:hypothetical protein
MDYNAEQKLCLYKRQEMHREDEKQAQEQIEEERRAQELIGDGW